MSPRSSAALCWCSVLMLSCQRDPVPSPAPALDGAGPATSSPLAAASAAAPAKAWYEGSWSGDYEAELHLLETERGGVREWKKDDASLAAGKGSLHVSIDADGNATGEAEGPLGSLGVSGRIENDSLALTLAPMGGGGPELFRGVLVARREQEVLRGALQVSTGDSLKARKARVELRRAAAAR